MKGKRSAVLCLGLLLLTMLAVWSQTGDTGRAVCPPLEDAEMQAMLEKDTTWVRADWNADSKLWDIRCSEMNSLANLPAGYPMNAMNTAGNSRPAANRPVKRRPHEE
jgi:hypothetical protein